MMPTAIVFWTDAANSVYGESFGSQKNSKSYILTMKSSDEV